MTSVDGWVGFGVGPVMLWVGCVAARPLPASPEVPAAPVTTNRPDCAPAATGTFDDVRPTTLPALPNPSAPPAPEPVKTADREPFTLSLGGDVSFQISFARALPGLNYWVVDRIERGEQVIYPPPCDKAATGLCSRPHRTVRGAPGGDERDSMFGMGPSLVLAETRERDGVVYALFASTFIGSPLCGTHAFWVLRADAKGFAVTPPVRGCFLSGGGPDDEVKAFEIVDTSPPTYIFRSPVHPGHDVIELYTLDERTMTFTSRYVGKAAKLKLPL